MRLVKYYFNCLRICANLNRTFNGNFLIFLKHNIVSGNFLREIELIINSKLSV